MTQSTAERYLRLGLQLGRHVDGIVDAYFGPPELPCRWAEVNAALMLHDGGASEAEVKAYLERWDLITPELADHVIRFFTEPTSRTYVMTYPAGRELCRSYVAGDPARFRRLLTEQVRVSAGLLAVSSR